jgi:hypothetical protein
MVSDYDSSGGDSTFAVDMVSGNQIQTASRSSGVDYLSSSITTGLASGFWHQAVYQMDGTNLALYVDGRFDHATPYNASLNYYESPHWWIGANRFVGNINNAFIGSLDDVRIYNRALTSNEVASLYAVEADLPVITQQSQAQTVNAGGTATFSVAATANHPLTYQWRKNSTPISGATNSVFTLSNVQSADIAFYSVTVSNAVAGVVSSSAQLNLNGYADPTWNNLVAYYPFNGNANDQSGNQNHGTNFGALAAADRFGATASSFRFDGVSSFIQTPVDSNLGDLSLAVWFRSDSSTGARAIVDSDVSGSFGHSLILGYGSADNRMYVEYHDGFFASSWILNDTVWHHAVAVFTSGVVRLYVDRAFIGSQIFSQGIIDGSQFRIGKHNAGGPEWFVGDIDDVRIYNRALSADEVAYLYQLETQTTPVPPLNMAASLGAGPSLNLIVSGLPGRNYVLQSATNLQPPIPWLPMMTNAADTNGVWQFTDTNLNNAQKFYRVTTP